MNSQLKKRLGQVIDRILSEELLSNLGLGNEIGFYIFDYPPEYELEMRDYFAVIESQINKRSPNLKILHVNLFYLLISYLRERKILDRAFGMQKSKGDAELLQALKGPLHESKVADFFNKTLKPTEYDLVLMSGIGNAWPILRSHTLLNNLHPIMENTPLVLFYPGKYDGQGLRLFNRLGERNYYRAFRLVP